MYKKVDASLDFVSREKEIIEFWKQNDVFEKSVKKNEGNREFTFNARNERHRSEIPHDEGLSRSS